MPNKTILDKIIKNILKNEGNNGLSLHERNPITGAGKAVVDLFDGITPKEIRLMRDERQKAIDDAVKKYGTNGYGLKYDYWLDNHSREYQKARGNFHKDKSFVKAANARLERDFDANVGSVGPFEFYAQGPTAPKGWEPSERLPYKYNSLPEDERNALVLDAVNGRLYGAHEFYDDDGFVTLPNRRMLGYKNKATAYMKMHDAGIVDNGHGGTIRTSYNGLSAKGMADDVWKSLTPEERKAVTSDGYSYIKDEYGNKDTNYLLPVGVDYDNSLYDFLKSYRDAYDRNYNYSYGSRVKYPYYPKEFVFGENMRKTLNSSFRDRVAPGNSPRIGEPSNGHKYWTPNPYDDMQRTVDYFTDKKK